MSPGRLLALWLSLAALMGCGAHRSGEAVRRIRFEVEGRPFPRSIWAPESTRALRREMSQEASSWQSMLFPGAIEPKWLDRSRLEDDGERLELWLVQQGYFDARFLRWEIKEHGRKGRKMHPVSIRGFIDEGEPSRIRSLQFTGIGEDCALLERKLRSRSSVVVGRVFSAKDYTDTIRDLRLDLLDRSFAFAQVSGTAEAFPEEHAVDVHIVVDTGLKSQFGPVDISGAQGLPADVVRDTVTIREGDPFSARALAETRAALFGLRAFSVVNVQPSLEAPATAIVPVDIELRASKWRRLKLGPGLELESGKGTVYGAAEWTHTNLFGRLWQFQQVARLGAAGVVSQDADTGAFALSQLTVAPVLDLGTALTIPHVLGPAWSIDIDGRVQVGIEPGYRFFSPELAPGLTWHPRTRRGRDDLSLALGYRVRYFDYFAFTVDIAEIEDSPLGLDLTDPYVLSMLVQHLTWDGRDDPISPTDGAYGSFALAEAGGPVFGNFNFLRAQSELRAFQSLPTIAQWKPRLVIAARVGAGVIAPYGTGDRSTVPYAERLYLGGGTTVRGWGADRLGPSVTVADARTGETEQLPAGGLLSAFGNFELRKYLGLGISLAGFTDVGRVWPEVRDFSVQGLQWSAGAGLRYATVIGPIRFDVGARLGPGAPEFSEQPRWTVHFGLSEAF